MACPARTFSDPKNSRKNPALCHSDEGRNPRFRIFFRSMDPGLRRDDGKARIMFVLGLEKCGRVSRDGASKTSLSFILRGARDDGKTSLRNVYFVRLIRIFMVK